MSVDCSLHHTEYPPSHANSMSRCCKSWYCLDSRCPVSWENSTNGATTRSNSFHWTLKCKLWSKKYWLNLTWICRIWYIRFALTWISLIWLLYFASELVGMAEGERAVSSDCIAASGLMLMVQCCIFTLHLHALKYSKYGNLYHHETTLVCKKRFCFLTLSLCCSKIFLAVTLVYLIIYSFHENANILQTNMLLEVLLRRLLRNKCS